jgi:hypothetical protein
MRFGLAIVLTFLAAGAGSGAEPSRGSAPGAPPDDPLPPGFVRGDVVSRSYVPIRTWAPREGIGILPYLFEYNLMAWSGKKPLEEFHAENIRRIDIASRWSTAIMLYPRQGEWRDEIIRLMLRCFRNRQLIVMANYYDDEKRREGPPYANLRAILDRLWERRDAPFESPEGDRATGRQLIDNILANKCGDEGESGLGTAGLERLHADFDRIIRLREADGERPFRHIKAWYNMIGYAALDYNGGYAASREDVERHRRVKLPPNVQAIGVDVYHYWGHRWSPFDPADLSIPRSRVRAHSDEWQRLRTRYYPEGLRVRVCKDSSDRSTWIPECWNDTHALLGALDLAGAGDAMMWYIAVCGQLGPSAGAETTYTTPIETMESYYEHIKAGPWVALAWWVFGDFSATCQGGLDYHDKTLMHFTPAHPEGEPYTAEMLEYWRREYVALKRRMFVDVVHRQFRHLNGPGPGE